MLLPAFPAEWTLSPWTGRPGALTIDPLGVVCRVPVDVPKRRWFQRRPQTAPQQPSLHLVVHGEWTAERVKNWTLNQLATLDVLDHEPDAYGDALHRLVDAWTAPAWDDASLTIDGRPQAAVCALVSPMRWAAFAELEGERVALIARDLAWDDVALRTATEAEVRDLRMAALRV